MPLAAIMFFAGCAKEAVPSKNELQEEQTIVEDAPYRAGEVIVQFDDDMISLIEEDLNQGKVVTKSMGLNEALDELGISSIERLFPDAGEFEARSRAAGMHRFYKVRFSESQPLTKAVDNLSSIPGVVTAEKHRNVTLRDFNDPKLKDQWHYYNNGTTGIGFKSGADVNVKPVWNDYTTGKSNVIVAVVDGGIDLKHEDLKDNVIAGGNTGSKNFVDGSFQIVAHRHGTHVAGTIGAVNNNGIGVCGLAGGDKENGVAGVKLLSCQIFMTGADGKDKGGDASAAIKWAADHGAVIAQNSWGYSPDDPNNNNIIDSDELEAYKKMVIPSDLKAAIDYFIAYAGCDKSGQQLPNSPMKGGVVIFAAGNDNIDYDPICAYDKVISVGAIDGTGNKSSFSNYGSWVDICAPGSSIVSTLPGNKYGTMSGTSMACPHVSGVAALIVSKFGGIGFTSDALRDKLLKGAKSGIVPTGAKIGNLVDALGAISYGGNFVPEKIDSYTAAPKSNNVDFSWNVPKSKSGVKAYGFMMMASKDRAVLSSANPKEPSQGIVYKYITTPSDVNAGARMTGRLSGLDFSTKYYVTVAASDYSSNYSALSELKEITTLSNNPPEINVESDNVKVKAFESKRLNVKVVEPDGHELKVSLEPGSEAAILHEINDNGDYSLVITGKDAKAGKYVATITAEDKYGLKTIKTVNYEILENQAPVKVKDFDNILLYDEIGKKYIFNGEDYITDPDGEVLSYTFEISDRNVIHINQSGTELYTTILGYGTCTVKITATDVFGKSAESSFNVLVRKEGTIIETYPNPVVDKLYISTGEDNVETSVRVVSAAGTVVYEGKKTFSAFSPLEVDMSGAAPGRYSVSVVYGNNKSIRTVVKE